MCLIGLAYHMGSVYHMGLVYHIWKCQYICSPRLCGRIVRGYVRIAIIHSVFTMASGAVAVCFYLKISNN